MASMGKKDEKNSTIKVKLIKSPIGRRKSHRDTVKGLGLRRVNSERILQDTPCIQGMVRKVSYMVNVIDS